MGRRAKQRASRAGVSKSTAAPIGALRLVALQGGLVGDDLNLALLVVVGRRERRARLASDIVVTAGAEGGLELPLVRDVAGARRGTGRNGGQRVADERVAGDRDGEQQVVGRRGHAAAAAFVARSATTAGTITTDVAGKRARAFVRIGGVDV